MRKLYAWFLLAGIIFILSLFSSPVYASSDSVVISQLQLNNTSSASNEFIEIYNNSIDDVEVTNWCLYYASASSTQNGSKTACFLVENDSIHLYLPSHSFAFLISNQLASATPGLGSDLRFSATLSDTAGHLRLINSNGMEIDKVGWGKTAISAEGGFPTTAPSVGKVISRKIFEVGVLQDTDNNNIDFELSLPRNSYSYGSIYELQDLCRNISGIQSTIPDGYSVDIAGICTPPPVDVCNNLDGLQLIVPNSYLLVSDGNCQIDVCSNIDGVQAVLPDNLVSGADNSCIAKSLPLQISEILPNAIGVDTGKEFIEIYNPNDIDVDLSGYIFSTGPGYSIDYDFPEGSYIGPNQYFVLFNDEIKFKLINTNGSVRLQSVDGYFTDETDIYISPAEGMAWALIDGVWQYTNQPTPGNSNLVSVIESYDDTTDSNIQPCAPNQYRSPDTNRCRLILTTNSILTPCKDGQYRSEETNRCRSIASDVNVLAPCAEGEERNPETNRCRSISSVLGASDLAPCKTGQERNPDTNRCRNIISAIPKADYAPQQTTNNSNNYIIWLSLAVVGVVAVGYGVWEWRQEINSGRLKLLSFLKHHK
ncbi:MAG: lamin tail domain-containing protein [Candidatus Saccharibacteria bacterium]